jgi:hypothetical protein
VSRYCPSAEARKAEIPGGTGWPMKRMLVAEREQETCGARLLDLARACPVAGADTVWAEILRSSLSDLLAFTCSCADCWAV